MIETLIGISIIILCYAFVRCNLNMKHIPHKSIGAYWRVLVGLNVSFILGYALYDYAIINGIDIEAERWVIACIFFAGSIFVVLVTSLSRRVFKEITNLQRETQRQADMLAEQLRKRDKEINILITTDPATGLMNNKSFMRRLGEEIERAKRYGYSFYIMRFVVNEIGKDISAITDYDNLLQIVGSVITKNIRNKLDCGCRCSGNEFSLMLANTSREQALAVARRIMVDLNAKNIDISIGLVAFHSSSKLKIDEICKLVEKATLEANAAGKHMVQLLDRTEPDTSNVIPMRKSNHGK